MQNANAFEIHSHTIRITIIKKKETTYTNENVGERNFSLMVGMETCICSMEISMATPQKTETSKNCHSFV